MLKQSTKQLIWKLSRFKQSESPPIALFASRRGGSTWMMDLLAVNRGVRYINQPFCLFDASSDHRRRLPSPPLSRFIHLEGEDERKVLAFVEGLLNGTVQVNAPWEIWKPGFDFKSDRILLKILAAKPIIDWLDKQFDFQIVYLTRHPIPTALSIIRNRWSVLVEPYFSNPYFRERHLTNEQTEFGLRVLADGGPLEHFVLEWVLENLVPLRLLPKRPSWLHVTYEDTLLNPIQTIDRLKSELHLPDRDRMIEQVGRASRSTKKAASTFSEDEEASHRLASWRKHVSPEDLTAVQRILDVFGVSLYRSGSDLPMAQVAGYQSASE